MERPARERLGTWLFIRTSAMNVAAMRLEGRIGDDRRRSAMASLMGAYARACATMFLHSRSGEIGGAAMIGPDGHMVAVYYGPADPRNTAVDWTTYSLQHRLVETEELLPLHQRRRAANTLDTDAYLPLAARDTRRNQ